MGAFDKSCLIFLAVVVLVTASFGIDMYRKCQNRGENMKLNRNFMIIALVASALVIIGFGALYVQKQQSGAGAFG